MYNTTYFSLLKIAFEIYPEKLNCFLHEALQGKKYMPKVGWREVRVVHKHITAAQLGFHYVLKVAARGSTCWVFRASIWHF